MFENLLTPTRNRWQLIMTVAFTGLLLLAGLCQAASKPKPPPPPPPSLSNAVIAYASNTRPYNDLWVANADGSNRVLLLTGGLAGNNPPSWSRDGEEVIFASGVLGNGVYRLRIRNPEGIGIPVKIVSLNLAFTAFPVWSPMPVEVSPGVFHDVIVYSDIPTGSTEYDIFLLDLDEPGALPINLTNTPDLTEKGPRWSPNATQIAVTTHREVDYLAYPHDIVILTVADCLQQPSCAGQSLVQGTGSPLSTTGLRLGAPPAWGNRGDKIAVNVTGPNGGNPDIFIIPIATPDDTWNLTNTNIATGNDRGEYFDSWSPNDDQILYRATHQLCGKGKTIDGIVLRNLDSTPINGCPEKLIIQDGASASWWRGTQP